jgi:hypothetical protein
MEGYSQLTKFQTIVLFILILLVSITKAQDNGFGAGILLGEPTGLSGKYWLDDSRALDFGLASSFAHTHTALSLHGDLIIHNFDLIKSDFRLPVYYGLGLRIHFNNNNGNTFGARGVLGIAWILSNNPMDIFIEVAPVFNIIPETSLHLDFSIGSRYYFNTKRTN